MKKFKYILMIMVAIAFIESSCTKDFLNVNEKNPNSASSVTPELLLPNALNSVSATMNNPRRFEFVYLWHGLWAISAGYSQPQDLVQYRLRNSSYQNAFLEFYTTGKNLDVIANNTDAKYVKYIAIANIMKAYIFQNLVDCWGNVPYSEAFKADAGNLKPKYDDQKAIYEDLVLKLDAAIQSIQNAPVTAISVTSASDIIYGGDMDKWLKFANTLKLRILLHQSGMSGREGYISTALATTASVGYIGKGEGALLNPGYVISEGKMNPFYETFYNPAGTSKSDGITYYTAGKDAVDFMVSTSDARINKFFKPYSGTKHNGNIFGSLPADLTKFSETSQLGFVKDDAGTMIGTPTKSSPILTDFEALFLQAEAAQKGIISGDAKALYEAAVEQSFKYMGLTALDATNYVAQPTSKTNFEVASDKVELIINQKWVALNGIAPVEIWDDYRRTGFPSFIHLSVDAAKENDTPPVRLLYPQYELNVNNDNVVAVGTINAFTSKIFWQNR